MKTTQIDHPLREIKLKHKNDDPLSEFESGAVKEYVRLHDVAYDLVSRKNAMAGEELKLELWLEKCDEGFGAVEQEVIKCGPAAGYTWQELDKLGITGGEVDLGEVVAVVDEYQAKVTEWIEATKGLYATFLKWREEVNNFFEDNDKFDDTYLTKMIMEKNDHALNSGSLYDDWEEFSDVQLEIDGDCAFVKNYSEYINKQNGFIDKVNKLVDRANKVSEVADEVLKSKKNSGFGIN